MAVRQGVRVDDGVTPLLRQLRRRDLKPARVRVAELVVAELSQSPATRQQARMVPAVVASKAGAVAIRQNKSFPFSHGAFFGAKRWRQFPQWVGASWDMMRGTGPYVITPTVVRNRERILGVMTDEIVRTARELGLEASNVG